MGIRGLLLRVVAVATVAAACAFAAGPAAASELIDRNATGINLQVNASGQALLSYQARGRRWRVLAWGALNARSPAPGVRQVKLRLDYSGGWGTYRKNVWRGFRNTCRPYDGPALAWLVTAC